MSAPVKDVPVEIEIVPSNINRKAAAVLIPWEPAWENEGLHL
jgi:hypothetical protein